jgi:transcriptional regulator with XRE-family HTH domain
MQNLLLLHLREQKGVTLKDIGQKTGISEAQYAEYDQGVSSITNIELVKNLLP